MEDIQADMFYFYFTAMASLLQQVAVRMLLDAAGEAAR